MRVMLTQVGLRNLVIFQDNRPGALAEVQGAERNERTMQRRKQGSTHGKTQNDAVPSLQA